MTEVTVMSQKEKSVCNHLKAWRHGSSAEASWRCLFPELSNRSGNKVSVQTHFWAPSHRPLGARQGTQDFSCSNLLGLTNIIKQLSLGIFHPAFAPIEFIKQRLQEHLPADAHILASQQLGISLTRWSDGQNIIVTNFATRDELIQALVCTLYLPFYCGVIPPEFRGERYLDGGLSNNTPFEDSSSTITVSPFAGTQDICPESTSASLHELNTFNASVQLSTKNVFLAFVSLISPSPESAPVETGRAGFRDPLPIRLDLETDVIFQRERPKRERGLTKDPTLWGLVSKDPPVPAEGTQDAGCDRGGKAVLALNWAVPNVLVKDVPNFEELTPELETALRKACMRKSSPWAHFWQSGPGLALTYLLLPCTLPVEYVYFRFRRVVAWLPDVPADLRWTGGLLRLAACELYSRTKARLLRAVSPSTIVTETGLRPAEGKWFHCFASSLPVLPLSPCEAGHVWSGGLRGPVPGTLAGDPHSSHSHGSLFSIREVSPASLEEPIPGARCTGIRSSGRSPPAPRPQLLKPLCNHRIFLCSSPVTTFLTASALQPEVAPVHSALQPRPTYQA
ncbi:patatin-like phospholipase domain-containing protein 5 [Orycteropus afer afer]|uniref:Patatin-like phospholipase domain-containing protein 5 n=1 Tax=Orycteropus afer afer TaxID=1230840 RepID=A0A8B6ZW99_ORYAF|nr:patatin-like phospholipase domain-containing protein 5 [Orycteropus afer afer]